MKRIFSFIGCVLFAISSLFAEEKDVTKFLGIPIDGFKPDMIEKLKAKGYKYNSTWDRLEGEFNGRDVYISVVTNNNKVYRICVFDQYGVSETDIKIRFNALCQQFENNKRYFKLEETQTLSQSEDISYQMTVNKKRYQASYYQLPVGFDAESEARKVFEHFQTIYPGLTEENTTEAITKEMLLYTLENYLAPCANKSVWFMISEDGPRYKILMYYDNKYNEANGEDL